MTKTEKKQIIQGIFSEIEQAKDWSRYDDKKRQLLQEITNMSFRKEGSVILITAGANLLCVDFDDNMLAKMQNLPIPKDAQYMDSTKEALLLFINLSTLPE